jgi:D-alanyl-D-alanine carboxypeptidase/D-alanyl-D-alanine-endopeptidase (penicillin-binding protein 4)
MSMSHPRRPSRRPCVVLLLLLAAVFGAGAATPVQARTLTQLRAKLTAESRKLGTASGAQVVDLTAGGTELFSRNADVARSPASNEKLLTTATALLKFGADATLATVAQLPSGVSIGAKGVVDGDLYLVGGGDPSLGDVALKGLASRLYSGGLRSVTGGVVGDESVFDARRGSFDSGFAPDGDLGGQLSGLTWGHGRATPGGPATVAAARLQFFLAQLKVTVRRAARTGRLSAAPGGAGRVLATAVSPPMSTLVAITNQPSDNFYAETLLKDLGARFRHAGSTDEGLKVVRTALRTFSLSPRIVDGSGLSREDHATPRQLVGLLRAMSESEDASLAVPGRIGTLAGRMRGTAADNRCHAKTGTLRGVSALSGYCRTVSNHLIAFSFLENDMDALAAKAVEDRMVPAIVSYAP